MRLFTAPRASPCVLVSRRSASQSSGVRPAGRGGSAGSVNRRFPSSHGGRQRACEADRQAVSCVVAGDPLVKVAPRRRHGGL